jgi:hypothetical protein
MLREGLAAEFPWAKRALVRVIAAMRAPRVSHEAPIWAAVSAFGATWTVGAIGAILAEGLRLAGLRDPAAWLSGAFTIAGYAIAVAVALRAGGRRGLAWYIGILALRIAIQIGSSLPGYLTFCERSGGQCAPMQLVMPYVYVAAGAVASIPAILLLRAGAWRPNVILNGAGTLSLLGALIGLAYLLSVPRDAVSVAAMQLALFGTAAFVTGVVMRFRSPHRLPVIVLGSALALTWIAFTAPFVVSLLSDRGGSQPASLYITGMTEALALGLGWLVTDARQRARTTAAA